MNQKELDLKLKKIGILLNENREDNRITILKVSKETGLNRNTISSLEKGKGQISSFIIYATYLNIELKLIKKED